MKQFLRILEERMSTLQMDIHQLKEENKIIAAAAAKQKITLSAIMHNEAETQKLPTKPKPSTLGTGLKGLAQANRDKKIIATKQVLSTAKWVSTKHRYKFINRRDRKEDVHQNAIKKNNPRKYLPTVGNCGI